LQNDLSAQRAANVAVEYTIQDDWGSGFTVNVKISNNTGSAIDGWTLNWSFSGNQKISNAWNADVSQSGSKVTVKGIEWNSTIPANSSVSFGFQGTYSGSNAKPVDFTVNGSSTSSSESSISSSSSESSISSSSSESSISSSSSESSISSSSSESSISSSSSSASTVLKAFPSAEGYGKNTTGGRGGAVYIVTNLNDSGAGSLRQAVEASGPRTVVFEVSGTITLSKALKISKGDITIAGQTAPGDGITLRKHNFAIAADNVIVRYIRVRFGDETLTDNDAVSMRYQKNIILDHVTASWGDDETLSLYHGENITVQWCMITETLNRGGEHAFAAIWGSPYSTFHHNLIAHNVARNVRFASGSGYTDYRNNVVYNWGYASTHGGEAHQVGNDKFNFTTVNMVGNYYKPGPGTESKVKDHLLTPNTRDGDADLGSFYVAGNYVYGSSSVTADN